MHAFSLSVSSESVMDTGKCNVFFKSRIPVASTKNQNVKLNIKLEFLDNSKQTDGKLDCFSESRRPDVSSWSLEKVRVELDSNSTTAVTGEKSWIIKNHGS